MSNNLFKTLRTWIEIDREALLFNFEKFKKMTRSADLMAIVKSNAYGHGLVLVSKYIAESKEGKNIWFGVDSVVEAFRLRKEGIKNPILVLGYTLPLYLKKAAENNISLTISNFESLTNLARSKRKPKFHIKIESGMYRLGFQLDEIEKLISLFKKYALRPEGIFSHFAAAGNELYTKKQIRIFNQALEIFKLRKIVPRIVHFAKTEGIVLRPDAHYSLVRLGIGLYGYYPARNQKLKPVMTWKTIVAEVKKVKRGEYIGYDCTEKCGRDSMIAVLPIGYWHGYDRGLSSIGEVLIHGKRAKVMGRVCMDMTMIDVTDIKNVKIGDEVVLLGGQGSDYISADEIGDKIETSSYEVLTRTNPLIKRILV